MRARVCVCLFLLLLLLLQLQLLLLLFTTSPPSAQLIPFAARILGTDVAVSVNVVVVVGSGGVVLRTFL